MQYSGPAIEWRVTPSDVKSASMAFNEQSCFLNDFIVLRMFIHSERFHFTRFLSDMFDLTFDQVPCMTQNSAVAIQH